MLEAIDFREIGHHYTKHNCNNNNNVGMRRFLSMFGISPLVCSKLWVLLSQNVESCITPHHLMWALIFLKSYNTEEVNKSIIGSDEKTVRKWVWIVIDAISRLTIVIFGFKMKYTVFFTFLFLLD